MDIKGTHRFDAPQEQVWEALMDPRVLSSALPGGEDLEQVGDNEYAAIMNVRVGPVQGRFSGKIQLSDINAPNGYRISVDGSGAPGFVQGIGQLELQQEGDGTLLEYSGEVQIGGRIAAVQGKKDVDPIGHRPQHLGPVPVSQRIHLVS